MYPEHPSVIAGFQIERTVGAGGMGTVYAARHPRLPRTIALKVLNPAFASDTMYRSRFQREGQLAASLDHPNLVPIYDCGEDDGRLWLSMRLVAGTNAAELLGTHPGGLDAKTVVSICVDVAAALDFAHQRGMLHRDVKPANILLDTSASIPRAMLSDFGIARDLQDTGLTATGMVIGTIDYCSPEQLGTAADIGGRADQYSLACTAFFLLTGSKPFPGATPTAVLAAHLYGEPVRLTQVRPDLGPAVENVLLRALSKDQNARFASCGAFADALRRAVYEAPGSGAPTAAPPALVPPNQQYPPTLQTTPPPHVPPPQSVVPNLYKPHPDPFPPTERAVTPAPYDGRSPGYVGPVPGYPPQPPVRRRHTALMVGAVVAAVVAVLAVAGVVVLKSGDEPATTAEPAPDSSPAAAPPTTPGPISTPVTTTPPARQQHNIARGTTALDPCRIPAELLRAGQVTTPLEARDGAGQMILCVGNAVGIVGPEILIGGYVRGSAFESTMLGNYAGGTPTLTDIPGWRRYNFTETDRQVWCKMGYRSTKQPVFTLEIAAILDPGPKTVRNDPVTRAARQTVCNRLPELARAIDPAMPSGQ